MDLAGYRARVRRLSGLRLESLLPTSDLDAALNEAYRELSGAQPWPQFRFVETVALAAGVGVGTLPVASREVLSVTLLGGDHARLAQTTVDELDRVDPDETGVPAAYALTTPTTVQVFPAPESAATLQVRGRRLPGVLAEDGDEPEFDEEFHPVLALVVAARLLGEEGDTSGRREAYMAEVGDMIGRMKGRYTESKDHGVFIMGGKRRRGADSRVG